MKKLLKRFVKRSADTDPSQVGSPDTGIAGPSQVESPGTGIAGPRPERFGLIRLTGSTPSTHDREQYPVDIVAVHGLNGDAYTTWTHKNGILWLRDLLPGSLPGCRVFTYGYPSQVAFSTSFATVQEYSRQLLSSVRDVQDESDQAVRPIIFVCHSLGGIVCKQALVFAHEDDAVYGGLLRSVAGIVFLGTPHKGSDLANLGSVIGKIINLFLATASSGLQTRTIRTDLVDYLKNDSQVLEALSISVRNRLDNLMIISFYESEVRLPLPLIVERDSAVLSIPREEIIPLYANHQDLCRFAGETGDYKAVSGALRRIAKTAQKMANRTSTHSSQRTLDESEKLGMRSFSDFDVSDYQTLLPAPAKGTCQWILDHPLFISWLEKAENKVLWLTGPPGCGKTVLSLFLARQLEEPSMLRRPTNVCIFFCDDKISKQTDAKNILINIIFQLIRHHRSLVRHAIKADEIQGPSVFGSFTALWALFVKIATDPRTGPTCIIIDAIDECEKATRQSLLSSIRAFLQAPIGSVVGTQHVKFVLTSRPSLTELERGADDASEHRISFDDSQGGCDRDIGIFIQQRVEEISRARRFSPEIKDFLQQTLNSKSDRTFLWVHVVLESLQNSPFSSMKDLQDIIRKIPPDLETTYLAFLSAIPSSNQYTASKLLKLILGSSRPLTSDEINFAFTINPSHRTAANVTLSCQTAILYTLQAILGPLVRISDSRVTLVHQSAKEFILDQISSHGTLPPAIRTINAEDCALVVASACIEYLLLDDFAEDFFDRNNSPTLSSSDTSDLYNSSPISTTAKPPWDEDAGDLDAHVLFREIDALDEDTCQLLVSKYAFYRYAALHWGEHFALCEASASVKLRDAVKGLLDIITANSSNWLRFYFSMAAGDRTIPSSLDAATLAAYFNLHETLQVLLGNQESIPQAHRDHALYWASERGHGRIVETLLRAGADPNARISGSQTPLMAASINDHVDCVVALLADNRTYLHMRGKRGRTALSFACSSGHGQIVKTLLSRDHSKADEEDDSGTTPLLWAAGGGHVPIVSMLAREPTVDVNHRDKEGRTAVSWAASDGMEEVLKTLLRIREVDVNLKDKLGRSPLSWAARNGCTAAVRVLLRDGRVDKASVDKDRRNAISWASAGAHLDTLRVLLKHGCPGVDDRDIDGWSPLAWAIQNDSPDTVETLISNRSVNLEQGDHSGRSALSWAVEYGHLEVVRVLLRAGANPSSRNGAGITPVSSANKFGRNDILEELHHYMTEGSGQSHEASGRTDRGPSAET